MPETTHEEELQAFYDSLQKGMGAFVSPPDDRRIQLDQVQAPVARPRTYRADDDDVPLEDQGQIGTCVGEAEGGEIEYRDKRDTGSLTPVSKLRFYRECKKRDGQPLMQGTFPSVAADVKVKIGAVSKALSPDNRLLTHEQIVGMPDMNADLLSDAGLRIAAGYAWIPNDLEQVLQAIFQNGTIPTTLDVGDWSQLPVKIAPFRGRHRVRLNGYDEIRDSSDKLVDAKIWFRNSWNKRWAFGKTVEEKAQLEKGNGYFLWSEYKLAIYDTIAYVDVPMALILEARAKPFVFTTTLKRGSTGPEVVELQKRLAKETAKDGLPCFRGTAFVPTFGPETERGVQRYQEMKGIVIGGSPETTGYGVLGPKTRDSLNGMLPAERPKLYPAVDRLRRQLRDIMAAVGQPIVITGEYRTFAEQDALYALGRTKPGTIVTNARGGDSMHNWRCAFDVAFATPTGVSYDGPWNMVGAIGKILGLEWGNDWSSFKDKPHFQLTLGYTLDDFKQGKVDDQKFA